MTDDVETLKKIKDSQSITLEAQQQLLSILTDKNTIVARYPLVEGKATADSKLQHR